MSEKKLPIGSGGNGALPDGYVIMKKIAPPNGINGAIGPVVQGGHYTVDAKVAAGLPPAEFEPLTNEDRRRIEQVKAESRKPKTENGNAETLKAGIDASLN